VATLSAPNISCFYDLLIIINYAVYKSQEIKKKSNRENSITFLPLSIPLYHRNNHSLSKLCEAILVRDIVGTKYKQVQLNYGYAFSYLFLP
jgi:hypothetical protein